MEEHIVASVDELGDGDRLVVQLEGRDIGVFNVDGDYYAYTSWCAHQGGPACEGRLSGTTNETTTEWVMDDEVLLCPWHGWEFDVRTGQALARSEISLPECPVRVENDDVVVSV